MKDPAATQCSYGKRICFPALRSRNGLAKRFSKLRWIRLCQLAEQVGCLTNRFIGNKQQYFCAAHCRWLFIGALSEIIVVQSLFLAANLYKCFGIFVIAMRYVRFVCVRIFRPWNRHGNAAVWEESYCLKTGRQPCIAKCKPSHRNIGKIAENQ